MGHEWALSLGRDFYDLIVGHLWLTWVHGAIIANSVGPNSELIMTIVCYSWLLLCLEICLKMLVFRGVLFPVMHDHRFWALSLPLLPSSVKWM